MELFYHSEINAMGTFEFGTEESRHITKVLRYNVGDKIYITNGKGAIYSAIIRSVSQKLCVYDVIDCKTTIHKGFSTHIAVAPTKTADRYEWLLEKATEIGIYEFTPIICQHSERKNINTERLQKIAISAMKQSLSSYLPRINNCIDFSEFIKKSTESQKFIAHCRASECKFSLKNKTAKNLSTLVVIGPEGDFSKTEIELASNYNYIPVSLGESRLRTETAAVVACHTVALVNEI